MSVATQMKKPKFNWKLVAQKINDFELKKQIKTLSKEIKSNTKQDDNLNEKNSSQQETNKRSQMLDTLEDKDNNLIFLKCLFSKKTELPSGVKEYNEKKNKQFVLKQKLKLERKKSLERKNKLLKLNLYKIQHDRQNTEGYNYVLRKKMTNFIIRNKNDMNFVNNTLHKFDEFDEDEELLRVNTAKNDVNDAF